MKNSKTLGLVILLLIYVATPMEEKHMIEYKKSYIDYQKKVSMLLILPQKK